MKVSHLFEAEIKSAKAFGPVLKKFGGRVPQFAKTKSVADVLNSYGEFKEPVEAVILNFLKAAKQKDVDAAVKTAKLEIDFQETAYAEAVASEPKLRKALKAAGFDAFADYSVLENTEPFQYVVFDASQVVIKKFTEEVTAGKPFSFSMNGNTKVKTVALVQKSAKPGVWYITNTDGPSGPYKATVKKIGNRYTFADNYDGDFGEMSKQELENALDVLGLSLSDLKE